MIATSPSIPTRPIFKATAGARGYRYPAGWGVEASGYGVRFERGTNAIPNDSVSQPVTLTVASAPP
jgi:hypothetical protein